MNSTVDIIISAREKDLGGFSVRRILPYASHRMVGPFIFFDHMGPAEFKPGQGMDVRPHPHVNLATVSYLFEGKIQHKDSLGSDQAIEPGAVNWMTAGRGIVHSERTPERERSQGCRMNGIQLWVALPEEHEESAPSFTHHPKESLPEFKVGDAAVKLLLGRAFGHTSPVPVHSDLFYAEIKLSKGKALTIAAEGRDSAIYVVDGAVDIEGRKVNRTEMAVAKPGVDLPLVASEDSRVMVIGGNPVGERAIFWNFVSSSKQRIEEAKRLWSEGPSTDNPRFPPIPGDDREFIPLPSEPPPQPKGTIM
jgi:redox-sensitive bicupin YhaK (pirin superfamily)